jgi:putative flippase GtrA
MQIKKLSNEIINYFIVGIVAVLVDLISYLLLFNQFSFNLSNSKRISYVLGAIVSFILNKKITFKSNKKSIKEPILFSLIYISSFILNSIIHDFSILYFNSLISFSIATFFSIVFNFIGQKFVVFKK